MDQETKTNWWYLFGIAFIMVTAPIWLAWTGLVILKNKLTGRKL